MSTRTRNRFVLLLIAALFSSGIATAYAGVISTQEYITAIDRDATIARIDAVLAREEVRGELERLGVDPMAANERIAAMTDQELQTLASNLENLPAGGDLLGIVGIVFIVLLILELVGVIDIFKKI
ncbi:MAG TPA: PA2779 family protein [Gammaproteobacteria bacterium]|nr:PA2779 family protein [Gammaproteobacteria bacterium]